MQLDNEVKLRAALAYLNLRSKYACSLNSTFVYTPAAQTNVKETIDIERDRQHDTRVWRHVTGK